MSKTVSPSDILPNNSEINSCHLSDKSIGALYTLYYANKNLQQIQYTIII